MEIIDDYYSSHEEDTDSEVCSEWSNQNENISLLSIDDVEPTAAPRGRPKKRIASVQDDVHLEFIMSKYGNPMVVMEGEIYKFRSKDKNGTTHWGCIKSVEGCKTCLETNSSNQCVGMSEGRHNHCTDKVEIEVRKIKSKVRVLACQDQSTPRQIYANVMENASEAAAARLDSNDISQIVYYHRQDEDPKLPCNPAIMIIPNELMMYKNEIFVLHDTGPSTRRMIVFSTPKLLQLLEESEYWGLDGTFDLVPKGFKQLLSIHAKVGETFVPCIHGLLPKKSSGTYNRFFAVLKQSAPHSQVRHSHVDYERSLMNSFNDAFPVVDLHGCFFHFAQCLFRKVQKFGLIRHYKEGGQLCLLVKMLKSLVYVPADDVKDAVNMILRKEVLNPDGTSKFEFGGPEIKFLDYFVKTWIGWTNGRPLFAVKLWNCFELTKEGKSKTTNSLEAWHNSLHYALATQDGKKPKFWKWLRQMKKECSLQEAKLASLRAGKIPKLKTAHKKRVNQRMEIAKKYTKEKLFDYVKKLGLVTVLEER